MFKPIAVQPFPGDKLHLRIADGTVGDVDLSHLAGKGVFALWNDPNEFTTVTIGPSGEIRWSDEVDLCPDALYMDLTGKTPEDVFPNLAQVQVHA